MWDVVLSLMMTCNCLSCMCSFTFMTKIQHIELQIDENMDIDTILANMQDNWKRFVILNIGFICGIAGIIGLTLLLWVYPDSELVQKIVFTVFGVISLPVLTVLFIWTIKKGLLMYRLATIINYSYKVPLTIIKFGVLIPISFYCSFYVYFVVIMIWAIQYILRDQNCPEVFNIL